MRNPNWYTRKKLMSTITKKIKTVDIVLDIGCGIQPQKYIFPKTHICCEPYQEYVDKLVDQTNNSVDGEYVIIKATLEEAINIFPKKSVDTIFLLDVIEHLEKNIGLDLIKKIESIARKQVILFTPLGYMPQCHPDGVDAWGLNGGSWQEHKSGWNPEDFDDSWDIYAAKEFHFDDHDGKKFEKPYGAMWIIKNLNYNRGNRIFSFSPRTLLHSWLDNVINGAVLIRNIPFRLRRKILFLLNSNK